MILTKQQLEKLNAYVGCGPHMDTDILVMGNEEGTGGYPKEIEAHCAARFRLYGKDEQSVAALLEKMKDNPTILHDDRLYQEETYAFSRNGDWREGFWEENDKDGERKIENYILARDGRLEKKVENPNSPFLNFVTRLCLALNHRDEDIPVQRWFEKKNKKKNEKNVPDLIDEYVKTQLFKKHAAGVVTALTDWRPLPRPEQAMWFEEYNLLGGKEKYEKAFTFDDREKGTFAYELATRRAELLGNLVTNSKARILLMIGEAESKKQLLRRFFPRHDIVFNQLPTRNAAYTATLTFPQEAQKEKQLYVYLMPFFGNGALSLDELHQFYRHVLLPDFLGEPRTVWERQKPKTETEKRQTSKIEKDKPSKQANQVNQAMATPSPERLESVVAKIREQAPELKYYKNIRNKQNAFRYMHFWYGEKLWHQDHFSAHLHDLYQDKQLELRLGIYCGKYQDQDKETLKSLVDCIVRSPLADQYIVDWSQKKETLILKKRLNPTNEAEEVQAAEELLALMQSVRQMYEDIKV